MQVAIEVVQYLLLEAEEEQEQQELQEEVLKVGTT
jgi:hypothetical protein